MKYTYRAKQQTSKWTNIIVWVHFGMFTQLKVFHDGTVVRTDKNYRIIDSW